MFIKDFLTAIPNFPLGIAKFLLQKFILNVNTVDTTFEL